MNQYQFKTNINCGGCVAKLSPILNENPQIKKWKVDIDNPNKILTVEAENFGAEQVKSIVEEAGFKATVL